MQCRKVSSCLKYRSTERALISHRTQSLSSSMIWINRLISSLLILWTIGVITRPSKGVQLMLNKLGIAWVNGLAASNGLIMLRRLTLHQTKLSMQAVRTFHAQCTPQPRLLSSQMMTTTVSRAAKVNKLFICSSEVVQANRMWSLSHKWPRRINRGRCALWTSHPLSSSNRSIHAPSISKQLSSLTKIVKVVREDFAHSLSSSLTLIKHLLNKRSVATRSLRWLRFHRGCKWTAI